ncbi:uncharacterized protein LOC107362701 [Tetranychus urticae]|uniref:uncharacterized protein LOC107362701 n=1 Tax=Tetranychus urticae TaxID=32264 RepID=UPI00077BBAC8|nr:uncharacterized protein LOC107362701 [Tetranychus urticae]
MQINKMRVLSPYIYNTPPGPLRPAKLAKYLARSRFKAIRSFGASGSAIQLSNETAYSEAKIFPKPNLSHITTNQAVQPQSSKVFDNFVKPEKVISNKLKFKVNNSTMSTSTNDANIKLYHRPSWIIMDDESEKMNSSPPPTISLNERFSNLPVKKKRDKEKGKHKKKRTRRISIPSNTWISIKNTKDNKCKQKRRAPKVDDDEDDNDQDQIASIRVKDDSFSHSEYSSNGLNDNENNCGSIRSEPSILDDLDVISADIDDNLLVDCMLKDWSDMDFILDPNFLDLSKLEESMMSDN